MPDSLKILSSMLETDPLPLVPVTCMALNFVSGFCKEDKMDRILSNPGFMPRFERDSKYDDDEKERAVILGIWSGFKMKFRRLAIRHF